MMVAHKPFTKLTPLALLLATAGLIALPAHAQNAPNALPQGGVVAAGSATISSAGNALTVQQNSHKAIIDWQSFNIGRDASVRFNQPSSSATVLNRVGADGGKSLIDGAMSANGQVWLLNPGGMLFGAGANINVGGLLASTLNMDNQNFMAGNLLLSKDGSGSIVNQGTLTAAEGGYVALLAPEVRNEGVITARLGTVALASGDEMRLDLSGGAGLIEVTVDKAAVNGLIDNKNLIQADGGWVLMSAGAASTLGAGSMNNTGIVRANSIQEHAGVIRLEGGYVALGGSISADAPAADGAAAGKVEVRASHNLSLADGVSAQSNTGAGGSVAYSAGGNIIETSTSHTNVSGSTDGGRISVQAGGSVLSSGQYSVNGTQGRGGQIDLTGSSVRLLSATLDATGSSQGGMVRVGGAFQGGKAQDSSTDAYQRYIGRNLTQGGALPELARAQRTFINDSSRINVSASAGAGGTAVVWSDLETTQLGNINAQGALIGGAVEISSADSLRHAGLAHVAVGAGGLLLLDPKNITIAETAEMAISWSYAAVMGSGYTGGKNVDVALDGQRRGDQFGTSVALNAAGDRLAVGAAFDDGFGNVKSSSGAVYLFSFTDGSFSGGSLQGIIGSGYTGGKNVNISLDRSDQFGSSVALNAIGDRLAVGAINDNGFTDGLGQPGAVHLFSFTDGSFSGGSQQGTIGDRYTGGKNVGISITWGERFGSSVSLNAVGDRLAVGANDVNGFADTLAHSGAVYLFSFTDNNFSGGSLQSIIGNGYTAGKNVNISLVAESFFGSSIALNAIGDRLVVGAPGDNGFANSNKFSGTVYLLSFTDGNFSGGSLQGTIGSGYIGGKNVNITLDSNDQFGTSVALNAVGDRLAVGASGDAGFSNTKYGSGAVHLFGFADGNFSGGSLQGTIGSGYAGGKNVNITQGSYDKFGSSVALSAAGDRLVVGATGDDGFGIDSNSDSGAVPGAVHLFSFTDGNFSGGNLQGNIGSGYTGGKNVNIPLDDASISDEFGTSIALNAIGDRLVVGAPGDNGFAKSQDFSGAVHLFSFSDGNFSGGSLQGTIGSGYIGGKNVNITLDSNDQFGTSVALNAVGDRLAVGAKGARFGKGAVHLFSFSDGNFSGGSLQGTIGSGYTGGKNVNITLDSNDQFGTSVTLNAVGDRLAIGASSDSGFANLNEQSGAVHLFSFADGNFNGGSLQGTIGNVYTGGKNVDIFLDSYGYFGTSIAMNATGDRLVVGATGQSTSRAWYGQVYLFSFTDGNFSGGNLQGIIGNSYTGGKNVNVTLDPIDLFGTSVALNAAGDRLVVGAIGDGGFGNSIGFAKGALHLFKFTDGNFSGGSLQGTIGSGYIGGKSANISLDAYDQFGSAVALNATGDRLAVGAKGDDGIANNKSSAGAVYLFTSALLPGQTSPVNASFAYDYATTSTVLRSDITTQLNAGTSVTLQANNDIKLTSGTDISVNSPTGNGGNLTLTAGRGILINSNINTDNGNLAITANATAADGVVGAERDIGVGNITIGNGAVINAGTGNVTLSIKDGAGVDNAAAGAIDISGSITAANINYLADNMSLAGASSATGRVTLAPDTTDKAIWLGATDNDSNLGLTDAELKTITSASVLQVGNDNSGNIEIKGSVAPTVATLSLQSGGDISVVNASGFQISATNLALRAAGNVDLLGVYHPVGILAASVTGAGKFMKFHAANDLTIGSVDGVSGITTNNGAVFVNMFAGNLTVANNINTGTGMLYLRTNTDNALFTLNSGASLTSTYAGVFSGSNVCGTSAAICIDANRMMIDGNISAVNQYVLLKTGSGDRPVVLGADDTNAASAGGGTLGLTNAELNRVTASTLVVANNNGGNTNLTVDGAVNLISAQNLFLGTDGNVVLNAPLTVKNQLSIQMGSLGSVTQTNTAPLTAAAFAVKGGASVMLGNITGGNSVGTIAGNVAGTYMFRNGAAPLSVGVLPWVVGNVTGVTAGHVILEGTGNLTLNAPVIATSTSNITVGSTTTTDSLCTGSCIRPHIEIWAHGGFANNVGSGALITPSGKYWALMANKPSTTVLNGLTPSAVSYDQSLIRGDILLSANRVFYKQNDVVPSSPGGTSSPSSGHETAATIDTASTAAATTVSQEAAPTTASTTETTATALAPTGGLGSGGASMNNFPTQSVVTANSTISSNTGSSSTTNTTTTTDVATTEATTSTTTTTEIATTVVEEVAPPPPPKLIVKAEKSVPRLAGVLNAADLQDLNSQVRAARTKLFEGALDQLQKAPKLADVADCGSGAADVCLAKPPEFAVQDGYLPVVKRKIALLIGNNEYLSPIPSLETAVNDVGAIGEQLRSSLGYDVRVVKNAGRKEIMDALNSLILTSSKDDSVVVMYAGHGYLNNATNTGYWIPSDGTNSSPEKWISNETITRALNNIPAKQVMLVSDSCYSGSLTKEGKVTETVGLQREQTLTRRSVLAFSSGGEEPVSDEGFDNHSIFAWNLIKSLKNMKAETQGLQLHALIKEAVSKDFPQVPQYGALISAGHTEGGEFLFTPKTPGAQ